MIKVSLYEFCDEQYRGHLSPSHVAAVPARQMADWRQQHGQGGDFMIYSGRRTVRLDSAIRVEL